MGKLAESILGAIDEAKGKSVTVGKTYLYSPVMLDVADPRVIKGGPIKPGARVKVTNYGFDPMKWFCWIEDEDGNEQSVFTNALQPEGARSSQKSPRQVGVSEQEGGPPAGAGPGGSCVCPSCGEKTPHEAGKPCRESKCPKCGAGMIHSDGPGPDGQVEGVEQEKGDNDILISLAHGKKKMVELVLRNIEIQFLHYDYLKTRMYELQKQGLVKVTEDESGTAFKGYVQITDKGKKVIDAFMAKAGVKAEGVIQEMWENMVELLLLEVLAEWGEEDIGKVCKTVAEWAGKTESDVRGELDRLAKAKLVTLTPESNKTAAITREGRSKYDSYQRFILRDFDL